RLTAHGSRLTAHGSRLTAHGSRLTAHGSRLTAHGSRLIILAFQEGVSSTQRPIPRFSGKKPH
ncbi:MAG: hypothetical protein LBG76_09775, partial [Treponema sp.]|nr:hypothetical protein [Treponema sp.]